MTVSVETKLVNLAHGAAASFENWGGFKVTPEQFLEMMEVTGETEYFKLEVQYPGAYEEPVDGLDTCVREVVFDVFAKYLGESHWPCNGDGSDTMDAFVEKIQNWIEENAS